MKANSPQLVSHGRPRPRRRPLRLLLRSAEEGRQAEGEHGGNEKLQTMAMCNHISKWLQRVAYFQRTPRHDDSVCPAHVYVAGFTSCVSTTARQQPQSGHASRAESFLQGVMGCGFGAWRDVSYLVEEHPGCWTCHQRRGLCLYVTGRRNSSHPGRDTNTDRHFG